MSFAKCAAPPHHINTSTRRYVPSAAVSNPTPRFSSRNKFGKLLRRHFTFLLPVLVFGCAGQGRRPNADLDHHTAQEILSRVEQNYAHINTLIGRGRIIVEMPGAQFSGHAQVFVKKPDSLFISAKAIFGVNVGFFFADRNQFSSYSPLENVFYRGPVTRMSSIMLFQMEISYEELLDAVIGTAKFSLTKETTVAIEKNRYVFQQPREGLRLRYEVDPAHYVVTQVTLFNNEGAIIATENFSRFRKIKNAWIPQQIRIRRQETREQLTIWYENVQINKAIAAQKFVYKVPENARFVQFGHHE